HTLFNVVRLSHYVRIIHAAPEKTFQFISPNPHGIFEHYAYIFCRAQLGSGTYSSYWGLAAFACEMMDFIYPQDLGSDDKCTIERMSISNVCDVGGHEITLNATIRRDRSPSS